MRAAFLEKRGSSLHSRRYPTDERDMLHKAAAVACHQSAVHHRFVAYELQSITEHFEMPSGLLTNSNVIVPCR